MIETQPVVPSIDEGQKLLARFAMLSAKASGVADVQQDGHGHTKLILIEVA